MSLIENYLKYNENKLDLLNELNLNIKKKDNLLNISYDRNISDMNNDLVKECRGLIYDLDNKKVLSVSLKCKNTLEDFIENIKWKDCIVEESIDGTLIILYYNNSEWNVCTKKTFDGKCRWCSTKTFNELFWETLELYKSFNLDQLNKNFCYSFILCNSECRNITKYENPKLYHITSINLNDFNEYDEEIGIEKPKLLKYNSFNITGCSNYNELLLKLNNLDYSKEGYMLYNKERSFRTKLLGKSHIKVKNLKGLYPIIDLRLVELIKEQPNVLKDFLYYFPEYTKKVEDIEISIKNIEKIILKYYTLVKKNNIDTEIPDILKKIIYELHGEYIELMNNYNPVTHTYKPSINIHKVRNWLTKISSRRLCLLINWYNTL